MPNITLGTVSHGTMRTVDLIDAFASELAYHKASPELVAKAEAWLDADDEYRHDVGLAGAPQHNEAGDYILEELFDALNELAPPFCYFGAHEGDGADYGFWPAFDALENAARCGEVLKVDDLADIPEGYAGEVMLVSDHGNVTFGAIEAGKFSESWACV